MRFLAPENFDTPNNKQGHEEDEVEHQRRIQKREENVLKLLTFFLFHIFFQSAFW
jgi:hypothetical protein